ncbi:MAG: hypothetical protein QOC65_754 [Sphingomonadales bacterium]|nr:hypothetical protein [Sphingomonadales bacterium]
MHRCDVDQLDPTRTYWVPAVVSPRRDWEGAPGCRRGARFMVDTKTLRPTRDEFNSFDSRAQCLRWIMAHRAELARNAPGASVVPVDLAQWIVGLA